MNQFMVLRKQVYLKWRSWLSRDRIGHLLQAEVYLQSFASEGHLNLNHFVFSLLQADTGQVLLQVQIVSHT